MIAQHQYIEFPRITAAFKQCLNVSLTILEAPPGFGKSALLSHFEQTCSKAEYGHVLKISPADNNADLEQELMSKLEAIYAKHDNNAIADPSKSSEQITVLVDDAHLCSTHFLNLIRTLSTKQTSQPLKFVLATRLGTRKFFAKDIINNLVAYLGIEQLALTQHEIEKMLRVSKSCASELFERFDGWPLPYLLLARQPTKFHRNSHIDEILIHIPPVFTEFVDVEVLGEIDDRYMKRAMEFAILDIYDLQDLHAICEAAAHELESVLDELASYFVRTPSSTRLNRIVREALCRKAWLESPTDMHDLCLRASKYFWKKGNLVQALTFAADSGEDRFICELIEQAGGLLLWISEGLELMRKVMRFADSNLIDSYPRLLLVKALLHVKEGDIQNAKACWDAAAQLSEKFTKDRDGGNDSALKYESEVMNFMLTASGCGNLEHATPIAQSSLNELQYREHSWLEQGYLHTLSCLGSLQSGSFTAANQHAQSAEDSFKKAHSSYGALFLNFHRGVAFFAQGKPQEAMTCYRTAERRRKQNFELDSGLKFIGKVLSAEVDLETGAFLAAKRKLSQLLKHYDRSEGWFEVYAAGVRSLLHIENIFNGIEQVRESSYQIRKLFREKGLERICNFVDLIEQNINLLNDQPISLDSLDDRYQNMQRIMGNDQLTWREQIEVFMLHSELLINQSQQTELLELLNYNEEIARAKGNLLALIKILVMRSRLSGTINPELVTIANESGLYFDFLISPQLRAMLSPENREQNALLAKINNNLTILEPKKPPFFTPKEMEIIVAINRNCSDKEIAKKLDISTNTVRFHIKNIFKKTDTNERRVAAKRAVERLS